MLRNERNSTCDDQQKETQIGYQKTNRTPYLVAITTIRPLLLTFKITTFSLKIHTLHINHHKLHITCSTVDPPLQPKIYYTQLGKQISVNWTQLDNFQMPLASTWSTYTKTSLYSTGDVDPLCILWIANAKWLTITTYPLAAANLTSTTKTTKQGLHRHLPTIAPTIEVGFPRVLYFK